MRCVCGASFNEEEINYRNHPYYSSSSACWKKYCQILQKTYAEDYPDYLRLLVDAYALQHPPFDEIQASINSVHVHLLSLYLIFEKGYSLKYAGQLKTKISERRKRKGRLSYSYLQPPKDLHTKKNISELPPLGSIAFDEELKEWAKQVYLLWIELPGYKERIEEEIKEFFN